MCTGGSDAHSERFVGRGKTYYGGNEGVRELGFRSSIPPADESPRGGIPRTSGFPHGGPGVPLP
ncbi:MAG: hypothetical protein GY846_19625 [Deltaproteobacteria bacterium]|nr:hypothetical protein [Deltaproteobacteria bacterium]